MSFWSRITQRLKQFTQHPQLSTPIARIFAINTGLFVISLFIYSYYGESKEYQKLFLLKTLALKDLIQKIIDFILC